MEAIERACEPSGRADPRTALRTCLERLPRRFGWYELRAALGVAAPELSAEAAAGLVIASTVNDRRRQHYPSPMDALYRRVDGMFEPYEEARHGRWTALGRRRHPSGATAPGPDLDGLMPRRGALLLWPDRRAA